jgi:cytochrome c553
MSNALLLSLAAFFCVGWNAVAQESDRPLSWKEPTKTYTAKPGEISARFTFNVRNFSDTDVLIDDVKPSCGCTVAILPSKPWRLNPKSDEKLEVLVDLRGKTGTLTKEIKVLTTAFTNTLTVIVNIPDNLTNGMSMEAMNRLWGQQLAGIDHQAVFKNDCVKCHLVPAFGKSGENLYNAACGICHEATHRATMVPDLHKLKSEIDGDYWRNWVTNGKPGTLMPGFAATEGGPLDDADIKSLVEYLTKAFPRPMKTPPPDSDKHDH